MAGGRSDLVGLPCIHEGTKSIYCMVLPLVAKIGSAGYPKEESVTVIGTNLIDIYEITL